MLKNCTTCGHNIKTMCMMSGFDIQIERSHPTVCGQNFEGWVSWDGHKYEELDPDYVLPEPPPKRIINEDASSGLKKVLSRFTKIFVKE